MCIHTFFNKYLVLIYSGSQVATEWLKGYRYVNDPEGDLRLLLPIDNNNS